VQQAAAQAAALTGAPSIGVHNLQQLGGGAGGAPGGGTMQQLQAMAAQAATGGGANAER
jgi:hypothetical protein